jgi:predicted GNAT family acetyltransferase
LDVHVVTHTSALDIPPSVWNAWRRYETEANIMYPHARAAYDRELAGAPPTPGQLWISLSSIRETATGDRALTLDFVLSCTEWAMGTYPVFIFCNPSSDTVSASTLKSRVSMLAAELRTQVPIERVYSVFAPTRVSKIFVRVWTTIAGVQIETEPYYSAVFTHCTLQTITRRRQTLIPDVTFTLRRAEEADIRAVAVLCQGFASTSEPFTLTEEDALKEATYLVRNRLVWVHDIEVGGVREIASIVAVTRQSENVCGITKVFTSPHIRKRGCAERLVRYVCQHLLIHEHKHAVVLFVAHNNPAAAKVYHRVGFQGLSAAPRPAGIDDYIELGFSGAQLGHW